MEPGEVNINIPTSMQVIEISEPGGPEVLRFTERTVPTPEAGEVLIKVKAIGLNRPDVQQRRGLYPPPPGANDLPGLDVAGEIIAVGEGVDPSILGGQVCALTNGGGYAQYCIVPELQTMPIPQGMTFVEAASLPEVYFTAWNNIVLLGRLAEREKLLIQGGTSGVGLAAIQIAIQLFDATVFATASSAEKRDVCRQFGVVEAFDYREEDWSKQVLASTGGEGVDLILDAQAGPYTQLELDLLSDDGRLVLIASHLGEFSMINARQIVRRRLTLCGSTLRPRSSEFKGAIAKELVAKVWPMLESGKISTRIHKVFDFKDMRDAHTMLDANQQIGKIVVSLD